VPDLHGSVDELVAGATAREPLVGGDGLSGATLERLVIDGQPFVLKHFDPATDWLLRATGDAGCRAVALWELGIYDVMPAFLDHTVVGAAREPERGPHAAALLMRDVSEWLVPEGDGVIPLARHHQFLRHLAEQHAAFWGWRDTYGLLPMTTRYQMLSPLVAEHEVARGGTAAIPPLILDGWARLDTVTPDLARAGRALANDPTPLVDALAATPATFVQGDWKLGNLGASPDGRTILLDWDRPGEGPPLYDLAWYLAVNCDRLPEPKEAAAEHYRGCLAACGVDTGPWWDAQLALCLLGGFLSLGWSKTGDELAWWEARSRAALDLL
jgi:hypothetical protein